MTRFNVVLILLAASSLSWAGVASVPNTFQSGTPALASEVNANFQALVDAINLQQTAISQLQSDLAAANAEIGTLQTDLATAESEINILQTDLDAAEVTIGQLVNDVNIAAAAIVGLQGQVGDNQDTIADIETNSVLSLDGYLFLDVDAGGYDTARFDAINVQVTNGLGATNGIGGDPAQDGVVNGLGNVIIGYNETSSVARALCSDGQYATQSTCTSQGEVWANGQKTGSHSLIVGAGHNYTRHGHLVAGFANGVNRGWSSVGGGINNIATGVYAAVAGGSTGEAAGLASSVNGGFNNRARGDSASIAGGRGNFATGATSSVAGGSSNDAQGLNSSVVGGETNIASGTNSSVSGGRFNFATGFDTSVSGGSGRTASDDFDWAAGSLLEDF